MKLRERWILAAILMAGLVIRVLATALAYAPTIDTGTVGLMACHILEGARPLYFYGQGYMGALEAYVAAGLIGCLGPSPVAANLAPTAFALGWAALAWGILRGLYGSTAGLTAAALLAIPPWHILWYSMATYGGYPEAWLFGLATIAIALHLVRTPGASPAGYLLLGLCTGLGFWINPQSLMYAGVGWLLVGPHVLFRDRRSLPWLALAVGCTVVFLAPALSDAGDTGQAKLVSWSLHPADWVRRFREFVIAGLRALIWSREPVAPWWSALVAAAVAGGGLAAVAAVARARGAIERLLRCAPLLVVGVSLLLALTHSMADERAPRYLIPLWSGLVCWLFAMPIAVPTRWIARMARVALAGWLLAQGIGIANQVHRRHPNQVETRRLRDQIVDASAGLGHPHTVLIGNEIFGHYGQPWNFHGRGKTRFVSSFDERCFDAQAAAEAADGTALACAPGLSDKTVSTLAALGVTYRSTATDSLVFFHDLDVPISGQRVITPAGVQWEHTRASAPHLIDRRADTLEPWENDTTLRIDFPAPVDVTGLLLCSPGRVGEDLPESLGIDVSADGATFRPLADVAGRFNAAYRAGDRIYLKGYHPAMEVVLSPGPVLALRIRAASSGPITLAELFLFVRDAESAGSGMPLDLCRAHMARSGMTFVYTDRRQSARLRGEAPATSRLIALPPYNPKNPASQMSRDFRPSPDTGILVEHRFADDAVHRLRVLYGPEIVAGREVLGGYELLRLNPASADGPLLHWNGFTILAGPAS